MLERFSQSIQMNPLAWTLVGLLVFDIYSRLQIGSKFTETCLAITGLMGGYWEPNAEGRLDLWQFQKNGLDIDAMVLEARVEAQVHERLVQEDSYEGRAYRWYRSSTRVIERHCGERSAEPDLPDPHDERY